MIYTKIRCVLDFLQKKYHVSDSFSFSLWLLGNSDLNMLLCYTKSMRSMACMFTILLSLHLDPLEQWSLTF